MWSVINPKIGVANVAVEWQNIGDGLKYKSGGAKSILASLGRYYYNHPAAVHVHVV